LFPSERARLGFDIAPMIVRGAVGARLPAAAILKAWPRGVQVAMTCPASKNIPPGEIPGRIGISVSKGNDVLVGLVEQDAIFRRPLAR